MRSRQANVVVGTTSTQVAFEVPEGKRRLLSITNISTGGQIVYLSWGDTAVAGYGVVLYPAGSWTESADSAYIPDNAAIFAIADAAAAQVAIREAVE